MFGPVQDTLAKIRRSCQQKWVQVDSPADRGKALARLLPIFGTDGAGACMVFVKSGRGGTDLKGELVDALKAASITVRDLSGQMEPCVPAPTSRLANQALGLPARCCTSKTLTACSVAFAPQENSRRGLQIVPGWQGFGTRLHRRDVPRYRRFTHTAGALSMLPHLCTPSVGDGHQHKHASAQHEACVPPILASCVTEALLGRSCTMTFPPGEKGWTKTPTSIAVAAQRASTGLRARNGEPA